MGYLILFAIVMVIIGFVVENLKTLLWIIAAIAVIALLVFLYMLIPKKRFAKSLGTAIIHRTVGKRNASITLTPNYNGTSYSGSIDYGDPGDTVYELSESYQLASGRIISRRESLREDIDELYSNSTPTQEGEYGELIYNLSSCIFFPDIDQKKAKQKFERKHESFTLFTSNIVFYFLSLWLFLPLFVKVNPDVFGPLFLIPTAYYGFFVPLIVAYKSTSKARTKIIQCIFNISICLLGYLTKDVNAFLLYSEIAAEIMLYFVLLEVIAFIIYLIRPKE